MTRKMVLDIFVRGGLVPAAVTVVLLLLLAQPWRKRAPWSRPGASAVALALGYLATYLAFLDWPGWTSQESWHYLAHLSILAIILGVMEVTLRAPIWARTVVRAAVALWVAWLIVPAFTGDQRWRWIVELAVCIVLTWHVLAATRFNLSPPVVLIVLVVSVFAGSLVAAYFGSFAILGQLCGGLVAALSVAVVVAIWNRSAIQLPAIAPLVALVFPPMMISSDLFDDGLPASTFLLPIAAPIVLVIGHLPWLKRLSMTRRSAVCLVVAVALLGAAIAIAMRNFEPDPYGYG